MESTQIMGKKTMKLRFIILQVLTLLLVAVVLLSFSNLSFGPTNKNDNKPASNQEAVSALENNLLNYQNQLKEKQEKIDELEASIKSRGDNKEVMPSVNETALKQQIQKLELELTDKESNIKELVGRIEMLEKAKPAAAASPDKALVQKLREDIQKLETRNALLVKLNNDLKKNNEFLSSQQKQ